MADALRLVATLGSPLAGEPPHLDSLLTVILCRLAGKPEDLAGYKVDRRYPCPTDPVVNIPLARRQIGPWNVARATSPIMAEASSDYVEHYAKRIGVEHATMLDPLQRKVVTTTNEWTKSYRLPLRIRTVSQVVWLCVGNRKEILKTLKHVPSIGKKISYGYGRVTKWECDRLDISPHTFWPWWIASDSGPVLMRPLPLVDTLPKNLHGARRDFGACIDPYWHPDRYGEIVVPC